MIVYTLYYKLEVYLNLYVVHVPFNAGAPHLSAPSRNLPTWQVSSRSQEYHRSRSVLPSPSSYHMNDNERI